MVHVDELVNTYSIIYSQTYCCMTYVLSPGFELSDRDVEWGLVISDSNSSSAFIGTQKDR